MSAVEEPDMRAPFVPAPQTVDMVVTVLSDGSETMLTVTEEASTRVEITVGDGGFRLDPLAKSDVLCLFSLSAN